MLMIMRSIKGKFLPKINKKNTTYVILVSFIVDFERVFVSRGNPEPIDMM